MDKKAQHQKTQPVTNNAIADSKDFNFELWANAVRKQMLSVLQEKTQH
ncbi:MAG: hypothetical protein N4J56_004960 [Chroococcidiopsis sp. SAG 2025]|nr:hypothetical protein [Chroococcidiopsis sp. SAG 2025]MDV2995306.1 hypothetical protein [Chroococcidiopsis sp. SAG 2025]